MPSTTFGEMLEEIVDLSTGAGAALMPLLLLSMPGIVLFVVLPAILLLALAVPLVLAGAVIAAPFLLATHLLRYVRSASASRRSRPAASVWPSET